MYCFEMATVFHECCVVTGVSSGNTMKQMILFYSLLTEAAIVDLVDELPTLMQQFCMQYRINCVL